jgi:thioredoxin-like negative regulator of GroEL
VQRRTVWQAIPEQDVNKGKAMTAQYVTSSDGGQLTAVDTSNFEREVTHSAQLVLVDFYSAWCVRCKPFMQTMSEFAQAHHDHYKVVKINIDGNEALWEKCGCKTIPALVAMKDGAVIGMLTGNLSKREIKAFAAQALEQCETATVVEADLATALNFA